MKKLLTMIGGFLGGSIGWWLGNAGGFFAAFIVSMIGTGIGIYAGNRLAARVIP
jgi:hypothetical protein